MILNEEQDAFLAKLYEEMYNCLSSYAYSTLQNYALTEEAVQETFRIACSKIEELYICNNPKGWLMNTLKNVLRNMNRSRVRLNKLLVDYLTSISDKKIIYFDEIDPEILYDGIVKQEDIKLLKYIILEKRSMLEAAQHFGISVEACKKRVQRAKIRIRASTKDD